MNLIKKVFFTLILVITAHYANLPAVSSEDSKILQFSPEFSPETLNAAKEKTQTPSTAQEGLDDFHTLMKQLKPTNVVLFKKTLDPALENVIAQVQEIAKEANDTIPDFTDKLSALIEEIVTAFNSILEGSTRIPGAANANFNTTSVQQWHNQWKQRIKAMQPIDREAITLAATQAATKAADAQLEKIKQAVEQRFTEEQQRIREEAKAKTEAEKKALQEQHALALKKAEEEKKELKNRQEQQLQELAKQIDNAIEAIN